MSHNPTLLRLPTALAALGIASTLACIGVSQQQGAEAAAPSEEAPSACPGGLVPAADGNVDDFEDGNNQTNLEGGRDGYWYIAKDSRGSAFEIPAEGFATAEGGADGSTTALHIKGTTASGGDQAWGIEMGMNFLESQGELYDASRYEAFAFKAKLGSPDADSQMRVSLADVSTHPSGGACTACYNHFHASVELTPEWKEYRLAFKDLKQRPGWGKPRPASVTPSQLVNINYQIGGGKPFDVWIDDMKLLECKK